MKTKNLSKRLTAGADDEFDWIPNPQRLKAWKSKVTKGYPRAHVYRDFKGTYIATNAVKGSEKVTVGKYARDAAPWVMDKETYDSYARDILG